MSKGKGIYDRELSESLPDLIRPITASIARAHHRISKVYTRYKFPLFILLFVSFAVGIIGFINWYRDPLRARSASTSVEQIDATDMGAASPEAIAKPVVPDPGQTVTIFNPQGKPVGVARTAAAFKELQKALEAHDEPGLTELTSSDQAYPVPSGTQAKFLDYGDGWSAPYEVRILNGEHAGERAFVYHGSVTK